MSKPITNTHDAIEIYIDSGSARLRFKEGISFEEGVSFESLLKEKIDKLKILIPEDAS